MQLFHTACEASSEDEDDATSTSNTDQLSDHGDLLSEEELDECPRSAFPPCWKPGIIGGRKSKPPSGKKRQPTGLCLDQRSPEGPRHLHRIPRLSEAPWEVP